MKILTATTILLGIAILLQNSALLQLEKRLHCLEQGGDYKKGVCLVLQANDGEK